MATLPIHLEVEDVAVGPVLIALRRMPGIIKLHLDLDKTAPAATTPRLSGGPSIQESVLAHLMKHDGKTSGAAEIASAAGLHKTSVYGALNQLKEKGMVRRTADKAWELTAKARRELMPDGAVKLLPKPRAHHASAHANGHSTAPTIEHGPKGRATPGSGWKLLRHALDAGPLKREDLIKQITASGISEKSITGVLERSKRDKLTTNDGHGTWQLTAKGKQQQPETAASSET
jgi:hypothetical protein